MVDETTALSVRQVTHTIGARRILDGLDLDARTGTSTVIMGPSGSGKSTLLSCALGLTRPVSGSITVAGRSLADLRGDRLAAHRAKTMGMVFQHAELLGELDPVENVALAALLAGATRADAYRDAEEILVKLGVPIGATPTAQLSGGERQRTAVARALINRPTLLLADEPTGALDEASRDAVADLLFDVPPTWNCALVVVTHDPRLADRADKVWHLTDGRLASGALA